MSPRTAVSPLRMILLAAAYFATARLGQTVAIEPGNITAVWIPAGLAVGALVVWGVGMWPGVWVGAFAYNFMFYLSGAQDDKPVAMALSLGIATGNTLMAISGSTLVELVRGTGEDLGRPRDALAYVGLAGLLSTTLSATIGTAVLLMGNVVGTGIVGSVWATWWLGDASGVILVAPLAVLLGRVGAPVFPGKRALLLAGSAAALLVLLTLVFGPWLPSRATTVLLALPIAFLSWTAFRLGRRVTMITALLIGAVAVTATARGIGPLVGPSLNESLILLHCFLDTAAFTGLILATTVRASRRVEATPAPLPGMPAPPVRSELERQMELAIAQRRREENALADRVRALADEARTLERQLERRVAERDAVLAVLPDLFYVIDRATQRFTMTSEAFARDAAGLGRDEVLGRTIYDVLPPALALRLAEQHREVFSTGDSVHLEETLPLHQGDRLVDTLKAPFRGPDGEITGLVSTSRVLSRNLPT